jgi:MATE family multidrug resistance protein
MAASWAVFVVALLALQPLGNHGLWLAFSLFFVARTASQAGLLPRLTRQTFTGARRAASFAPP